MMARWNLHDPRQYISEYQLMGRKEQGHRAILNSALGLPGGTWLTDVRTLSEGSGTIIPHKWIGLVSGPLLANL